MIEVECTIYCSSVARAEARRLHRPSVRITFPFSFSLSKAEMIVSKNRDSSWVCRNQSFGIPQLMFGSCHIWRHRHALSPDVMVRRVFGDLGNKIAEIGKKELFYRELRAKQNLYSHGWIRRHVLLMLGYCCQLLYQMWVTKVKGNVMSSHGSAVVGMPLIWDL